MAYKHFLLDQKKYHKYNWLVPVQGLDTAFLQDMEDSLLTQQCYIPLIGMTYSWTVRIYWNNPLDMTKNGHHLDTPYQLHKCYTLSVMFGLCTVHLGSFLVQTFPAWGIDDQQDMPYKT